MYDIVVDKNNPNNQLSVNGWYIARLIGELGFIIAIPLILFLIIGRAIDIKLGLKVVFTLAGMALALIISSYIIYKKIQKISQ